jgi:glycosyltransferase involved in cell wall biosynthesis
MKLALIRRQFSATGGAELYLQRLLEALAQRGHELHLFAETWTAKPANVVLHSVKVSGTRAQKPLRFAEAVRRELAAEKFDCVFSLERTLRQDVYRAGDGVHRVWLDRRRQFAPVWKRPFIGLGAFHRNMQALEAQTFSPQNTGHIIVNSEMVRREIVEHFSFPADRIHLVRNGVDIGSFQNADRAAARTWFGVKDDEYLLLFVGSGWERKGLKYLLRVARALQGNDLLRAWLAEEISQSAGTTRGKMLEKLAEELRVFGEATQKFAEHLKLARNEIETTGHQTVRQFPNVKLLVVGKGNPPANAPPNAIFSGPLINVEQAYAAADLFVFLPIYEPSANVVFEALACPLSRPP